MSIQQEQQRQLHHFNARLIDRILFHRDSKLVTELLQNKMIKPIESTPNHQIAPCVDQMAHKVIKYNSFPLKLIVLLLWAYTHPEFRDALFDSDDGQRLESLFERTHVLLDAQIRGNAIQCANASVTEPKQFLYYNKKQIIQNHQLRMGYLASELSTFFAML